MKRATWWALGIASGLAIAAPARAQDEAAAPSLPGAEIEAEDEAPGELDLNAQMEELRERLRRAEDEKIKAAASPLSINGYVDFGFFAPRGNRGVGWVRDVGNRALPAFSPFAWTFYGDILGTPVNTRGEAADLGDSPGADRYDSIASQGAGGFVANEFNLRVGYQLGERAILRTSVNFAPRSARRDFALGDTVDIDLAEMEYVLTEDGNHSIFVGKTLPVFGIEYKERKSHQRFGVTPSLVHRYTSEPQLGLKFRSKLLREWIVLAGAVTNNSSTTEQFHFHSEIDQNWGKTLSGRAALNIPIGDWIRPLGGYRLELGGSGQWGPQDRATDTAGKLLLFGADLQFVGANFALKGQWMRGRAPGRPEERVWTLDLRDSGYVELNWLVLPYVGLIGRAEKRDAIVTLGRERAYVTNQARFTGGLRVIFNPNVVLKAEYLYNHQLGDIPQFRSQMFTSSLVLGF
jgi:hypothetical protein